MSKFMVVCCYCGEIFEKEKSAIKQRNFCCKECLESFNREKMSNYNRKENPMNKKGGSMSLRVRKRQRMLDYLKSHPTEVNEKKYAKVLGKFQHRLLGEIKIGRELRDDEVVHHIDGNPLNNSLDNLEVMTRSEHMRHHVNEFWLKKKGLNEKK